MRRIEGIGERAAPDISEIKQLSEELFAVIEAQHLSEHDITRIEHAYHLAMRLHAQQEERSDGPYTHHILRVTLRVARTPGATTECIVAALLHDAYEDQRDALSLLMRMKDGERLETGRIKRFKELFGDEVYDVVTLLTKKPPRLGHKKPEYRDFILSLVTDERALLVKVSDFLDNALGILDKPDDMRVRLARKWAPVVPLLTMALRSLKHEHGIIAPLVRTSLIIELEEADRRLQRALKKTTR